MVSGNTGSFSATAPGIEASSGPSGYCWPGHAEIEHDWVLDRTLDAHDVVFGKDSETLISTYAGRKVWKAHGDGKGYKWHAASAGKQLGTKAVLAYGAVASCLGTTKWWISYRTDGDWRWLLEGWECPAGSWGSWRIPANVKKVKFLRIPIYGKYKYDRFDIKFHAESESGAIHRYYVEFWYLPDT